MSLLNLLIFFFSNNNIQNKGFKLLCESIVNYNSPLTILIVWNNNLDQECSEYLANLMVNTIVKKCFETCVIF